MKTSLVLVTLLPLLLAGCDDNSSKTSTSGGNPVTAPVDYLGAVQKAQQHSVKQIDTASINEAIKLFQVDKGRNPKDLNELVQDKYLGQIPAAPYGMKI